MGDRSVRSWAAEQGTAALSTQGTKTLKSCFGERLFQTVLHDNPRCSSSRAMPHARAVGAHLLSPSHTCLLWGYERSHREAAVWSPSVIFPLTFLHPPAKVNKSSPFMGTWYQPSLVLSVPPKLYRGRATPCEGRTSPAGHAESGATASATRAPALVPSVS